MKEGPHSTDSNFNHLPIMGEEILQSLKELPNEYTNKGLIIDSTLGGGGHSALLLEKYPRLHAIGIDQDPYARNAAAKKLIRFGKRVTIVASNFADFNPPEQAVVVLADLGVSSPQLDKAERGFSFRLNGQVDMRMIPEKGITASELIDSLNENELASGNSSSDEVCA